MQPANPVELCPICLDGLYDPEKILTILQCHHIFHEDCIAPLRGQNMKCPSCRRVQVGQKRGRRTSSVMDDNSFEKAFRLRIAAREGDIDQLRASLAEPDADVNTSLGGHCTPLHSALFNNNTAVAELLLEHGADVHAITSQGATCLRLAIIKNNYGIVENLVRKGADIHQRDKDGRPPIEHASRRGLNNIVELLIRHGAQVEQTTIDCINQSLYPNVHRILTKAFAEQARADQTSQ